MRIIGKTVQPRLTGCTVSFAESFALVTAQLALRGIDFPRFCRVALGLHTSFGYRPCQTIVWQRSSDVSPVRCAMVTVKLSGAPAASTTVT